MGNRISGVMTRTGDKGETGLANGSRVRKDSLRINALGDVDELNSVIGLVVSENVSRDISAELVLIQNELFNLGAGLAMATGQDASVDERQIERIEQKILSGNRTLPPLKEFILPGGARSAALLHFARCVCRRAERSVVALSGEEGISPLWIRYLNRLSDLFFVFGRLANQSANRSDVFWKR